MREKSDEECVVHSPSGDKATEGEVMIRSDGPRACARVALGRAFWIQRWTIVGVTISCAALFSVVGALITPKYKASVTVLPLSPTNVGGLGKLGSMGSVLGGLGSLVGLSGFGNSFKEEAK